MTKLEIVCDECGKDISDTGNCVDYRIMLCCQRIHSSSDLVTLRDIEPCLRREHHFCGPKCLKEWISKGGI